MNKINDNRPEVNILFDYVTITFPVDISEDNFRQHRGPEIASIFANDHFKFILGLLNLDMRTYSAYGKIEHYDELITYGEHINVKFNGPKNAKNQHTHAIELKGEGCREAETLGINWYQLFAYIHEHNLTVSTLHLAGDIFTKKYFDVNQLLKKALNHEYLAFSRKFSHILSEKSQTRAGTSLYFGNRDNNQVNIYDKKSERYYKGYDVDTNVWIRIEIRLKTSKTWDFIRRFVLEGEDKLPALYFRILNSMLEFKSRSKTTDRKDRWSTWQPWQNFLKTQDKIKLVNQAKLESTLVKKREWLLDSAGKILLEYFSSIDEFERNEFFEEVLNRKLEKIDNKSLVRINQYRQMKDLPIFKTLDDYKNHILKKGLNTMKGHSS